MRTFLIFCLTILTSCTQHEQQPELKDYEFIQIQGKVVELDKAVLTKTEECKKLFNEAEASKPQTGLKSKVLSQWKDCNKKTEMLAQELKFNQVSLETRRASAAAEYSRALKDGTPWPKKWPDVPHGTNSH